MMWTVPVELTTAYSLLSVVGTARFDHIPGDVRRNAQVVGRNWGKSSPAVGIDVDRDTLLINNRPPTGLSCISKKEVQ